MAADPPIVALKHHEVEKRLSGRPPDRYASVGMNWRPEALFDRRWSGGAVIYAPERQNSGIMIQRHTRHPPGRRPTGRPLLGRG